VPCEANAVETARVPSYKLLNRYHGATRPYGVWPVVNTLYLFCICLPLSWHGTKGMTFDPSDVRHKQVRGITDMTV